MRFIRIVLALTFGLAMAGPETHACPVHGAAPVHHQDTSHQKSGHCTCPQACCPAGVVAIQTRVATWTAAALPLVAVDLDASHPPLLPARKRFLPFALAPPPLA